ELKLFSESIKGTKQYSCSEGEKEVNRKKNRYKDILPFDVSRVVLNEYAGVPGSDYINANYIRGASGSPAYIASQGPLPHTVNDFWRMVVQCEVQVIVMACNEEEAGKHKCENYWVEGEGEEKQFGMVSLRLIKASTVCPDFSVRTMRLKYTNTQSNTEERTVCQFHYSAWPDHGVPPLVRPLLDMVRLVRDTQASETLPVLIHCSAGCGRTGTICAIDYVWGLLRAGKLTKDFSLLSLVREMRRQRIAMVQTKEQYVLVHQAVRELFREQLRMIDSHPYENIDCNGLPLIECPSPEPTYDSIIPFQNNKAEEKQDEKEKEQAPPLPQKKRFQTLSSKQAKEVENLSERQRLAERAGCSGENVASPRIATLRSLFERQHTTRDSRQVARSHSLGSVRPPAQPNFVLTPRNNQRYTNSKNFVTVSDDESCGPDNPSLTVGFLRVPQTQPKPALPVKRSKSLRVLGSGDRCKLSIPRCATLRDRSPRRLSLESNYDEIKDLVEGETQQPLVDYLSVDSIVAGLGIRERRNSFRQAMRKETQEVHVAHAQKNLWREGTLRIISPPHKSTPRTLVIKVTNTAGQDHRTSLYVQSAANPSDSGHGNPSTETGMEMNLKLLFT
ncbi:LOW QUALITY PROTEIN: tyrosine-protein phosphatase non-receptor type 12-like, partial [Homalodisca vitripennis]|uniref:LOW QUALITY PROTEIN: tyrosine-protein phosphatase non-receptor type 12-like n=1 Tax=Homalodisca vitripennis TaxID=197043 RepID=UPI001EEC9475